MKRILNLLLVGVLLASSVMVVMPENGSVKAATRTLYWVGGTGNWSDTAHWSLATGGAGGEAVPDTDDDVYIDVASGSDFTITVDAVANTQILDFTGSDNVTLAFGTNAINYYSDVTLAAGMTVTASSNGGFYWKGTGASTFTSNGVAIAGVLNESSTAGASSTVILGDDLNITNSGTEAFGWSKGTFSTGNYSMTIAGDMHWTGTSAKTALLGTSNLSIKNWVYSGSASGLSLSAENSTITIQDNISAGGGNITFGKVIFTTGGSILSGNSTFGTLEISGVGGLAISRVFADGTTQVVTDLLDISGTPDQVNILTGSGTNNWTISAPVTATVNAANVKLFYSQAIGGANFTATEKSLDSGGNSGWSFPLTLTGTNATGTPDMWGRYQTSAVMPLGNFALNWWDGATYYSYYAYDSYTKIGRATSADGITWTEDVANNPVLAVGAGGTWDSNTVNVFNVWQEAGTWYAMYRGKDAGGTQRIGLATSVDGITWVKDGANPVIDVTDAEDPAGLLKDGATYYLYTNSAKTFGNNRDIRIFTSTDLITWTIQTPSPTFSNERYCSTPFKYHGKYYILISKYYGASGEGGIIELWEDDNPTFYAETRVLKGTVAFRADAIVDTPTVITDNISRDSFPNNELWMYYSANGTGTSNLYALYLAGIQTDISAAVGGSFSTSLSVDADGVVSGGFTSVMEDMGGVSSANVSFEYGLTVGYGGETTPQTQTYPEYFIAPMADNLTPGQTYHYRSKAVKLGGGVIYGSDETFTLTMPTVTTGAATITGGSTVNLAGSVTDAGVTSSYYTFLEYWNTDGTHYTTTEATGTGVASFNDDVTGVSTVAPLNYRAGVRVGTEYAYGSTVTLTSTYTGTNTFVGIVPMLTWLALIMGFVFMALKGGVSMKEGDGIAALTLWSMALLALGISAFMWPVVYDAIQAVLGT